MNDTSRSHRAFLAVLTVFVGTIAFSLGGSVLMRVAPEQAARAGTLLPWLMRVPTWIYMACLPLLTLSLFWPALGAKRSFLFLLWGSAVGAGSELLGTTTGIPFGPYGYTDFLGPKILGHVPWAIPPSWYAMGIVSLDLAGRMGVGRAARILATAVFMVLWDVALDPAMGYAVPVWIWGKPGPFYGMPLENWIGWFVTSLAIAWGYEALLGGLPRQEGRWPLRVWLLNGLFPLGLSLIAGLRFGFAVGVVAIAVPPLLVAWRARRAAA